MSALTQDFYRRNGDRIGTLITEIVHYYCVNDNAYHPEEITLRARACRLEWQPKVYTPEPQIDLFAELFGN